MIRIILVVQVSNVIPYSTDRLQKISEYPYIKK